MIRLLQLLLLLFSLLAFFFQLLLDLIDLFSKQVVVLRARVCHLVHIALNFTRIRYKVVHTLVKHRLRIGCGENCLHEFVYQMVAEIGRHMLMPFFRTLHRRCSHLSRLQTTG